MMNFWTTLSAVKPKTKTIIKRIGPKKAMCTLPLRKPSPMVIAEIKQQMAAKAYIGRETFKSK